MESLKSRIILVVFVLFALFSFGCRSAKAEETQKKPLIVMVKPEQGRTGVTFDLLRRVDSETSSKLIQELEEIPGILVALVDEDGKVEIILKLTYTQAQAEVFASVFAVLKSHFDASEIFVICANKTPGARLERF
jgi:hypothetical protein